MKVAMTGATGFIGLRVVKALLDMGHQVIAILHNSPLEVGHPKLKTIKISFKELASSQLAYYRLHQPDVLLDLGWQDLDDYNHSSHLSEQVESHLEVVESLVTQGLKRVVGIGTCFEYGEVSGEITEEHPCQPTCNYAKGKLALFQKLNALQQQKSFELVWLRPFYVYGFNSNRPTLFNAIQSAIDSGESYFELKTPDAAHDFSSVEELGKQLATLSVMPEATGVINCCSAKCSTVKNIATDYADTQGALIHFNEPSKIHEEQPPCFWGDNSKMKQLLLTIS